MATFAVTLDADVSHFAYCDLIGRDGCPTQNSHEGGRG